jgi:hypothetical protein
VALVSPAVHLRWPLIGADEEERAAWEARRQARSDSLHRQRASRRKLYRQLETEAEPWRVVRYFGVAAALVTGTFRGAVAGFKAARRDYQSACYSGVTPTGSKKPKP